MKPIWKVAKWTGFLLLVVVAYVGYRIVCGHPFTINQLANRQGLYYMMDKPELFTSIGVADGTVFDHHSGRLSAVGNAKRDHDYAEGKKDLDEVRRFDRASFKGQDRVTYDVLSIFTARRSNCRNSIGSHPKDCIP